MSTINIRPSSLDGIKRLAKQIKVNDGLAHARALDAASRAAGFQNYTHARRGLNAGATKPVSTLGADAFVTVYWRDRKVGNGGRETLRLRLSQPLANMLTPAHLRMHSRIGGMRFEGPDHLRQDTAASDQEAARHRICTVARVLQFMDATGLRPSAARRRAYPAGHYPDQIPGLDHSSIWFDPAAGQHILADEPYDDDGHRLQGERQAWARRAGWEVRRPAWGGMYNPDGGCELYLMADASKGYSLDRVVGAIERSPKPILLTDWNGESAPLLSVFVSPLAAAVAAARSQAAPARDAASKKTPPPRKSITYRGMFGAPGRRPPAKMPVEAHAEIGRLLKSVLEAFRDRRGVYSQIDATRCRLDDWVQLEYSRLELADAVFFDLYYHELAADDQFRIARGDVEAGISRIAAAKRLLVGHYPDSTALRDLTVKLDRAVASLLKINQPPG